MKYDSHATTRKVQYGLNLVVNFYYLRPIPAELNHEHTQL